jgi:hypothetical protein
MRRSDLDRLIAAGETAGSPKTEAARDAATAEALAELRAHLDSVEGEDDPGAALTAIAEAARALADNIEGSTRTRSGSS